MADEITVTTAFKAIKGDLRMEFSQLSATATMSGDAVSRNVQSIPTTAAGTALVIAAGVSTLGWARLQNLDSTNYVEVGVQVAGTFYPVIKLKPSEPAQVVRFAAATLYARANTGAVNLDAAIVED